MVRVFVNHVDSYTGKALSKVLSQSVVGGSVGEPAGDGSDPMPPSAQGAGGDDANRYEVVGTVQDPQSDKPEWVAQIITPASSDDLLQELLACDVIVYHVTDVHSQVQEATWAAQALHDELSAFASQKVFVCVSTVLTWARSKPLDPEEPDVPFTEEDYRRRRTHPNFTDHIALEKLVIKVGKTDKSKFISYIIAVGLTYGAGESIFHFLFKAAWHGDIPALPIFGEGQNVLPTIHVMDLASVVFNLADSRPKSRYILAVDDSHSTLEEIVSAISTSLGTGRTKKISKEDALLNRDISQCEYDQLLVNLQMEATCVKEAMHISWKAESGLVENVVGIIKEYKEARVLLPIRVCVLGPPAVGKSLVVSQLCQHYKLHHLKIAEVIKYAIEKLERTAARADVDDEDEDDGSAQNAQEFLDLLKGDLRDPEHKGRYSEQYILEFYKQRLVSKPCQNQGFILDGFPKTYEQAKRLFAPEEEEEEEDEDTDQKAPYNKLTMPEVVVSLEASDEFLKQRVMNLPQSVVEGTHNTEQGLLKRLEEFRSQNEDDSTVLNYFDELETHPEHINIEQDQSANMQKAVDDIKKLVGIPRNYGPTPEERTEMERKALEEQRQREARERAERDRLEQEERALRAQREAEWSSQLAQVRREEQEMLETQSIPLRNYLMQHVMPTLTQGLVEVCKVKPEDSVDYLAEYLFKHNPQID